MMYFEIYKERKLIKRGTEILGGLEWENSLSTVPDMEITLPIKYMDYLTGREEMKIFVNDKVFWGIVIRIDLDKNNETMDVRLYHVVHEWTYRQISVNNAIKEGKVNVVYKGAKTASSGVNNVTASPFTMLSSEVGTFTPAKYIERAGASGWTSDGETLSLSVDSSKVQTEEGEYDVTFTAGASVTVKATVKSSENETERDDYKLTANDFSMYGRELPLTSDKWIAKAKAKCEPSLPITVDASSVKTTTGTYTIKFTVTYQKDGEDKEMSVSVTAIVIGEGEEATVADNIADIFSDTNFAYPGWRLNMSSKASNTNIDYVYSRQNKLEALTKTTELTDDLFWRVRFVNEKVIDISQFGTKKDWIISVKPSGVNNIQMISDPSIEYDFENVINLASVYSEKSDTGMSSMTLREVYNDPDLQKDGFPVVILRNNANNERDYRKYTTQYPKLAPNNELEYAVIDEESVAMEGGHLIEGTYAFTDLAPFEIDLEEGEEITDKDRIEAAKTCYTATIRKLKQARRRYKISFMTTELPSDIAPGDRVRFIYDNSLYILDTCTPYMKKLLGYNDYFYITDISYEIDRTGAEVDTVTLEKELRTDRETRNE